MPFLFAAFGFMIGMLALDARAQKLPSEGESPESRLRAAAADAHAAYSRRPFSDRILARRLLRMLRRLRATIAQNPSRLPAFFFRFPCAIIHKNNCWRDAPATHLVLENIRLLESSADVLKHGDLCALPVTHGQLRTDLFAQNMLRLYAYRINESTLRRALCAYEEIRSLSLHELETLKESFLRVLLREITSFLTQMLHRSHPVMPELSVLTARIDALRALDGIDFARITRECSGVCALFALDPSGVYVRMDEESRLFYRRRAACIAREVSLSETTVIHRALALCHEHTDSPRNHIGYYLLEDDGVRALMNRLGGLTMRARARFFISAHPSLFWLLAQIVLCASGSLLFYLIGAPAIALPVCALVSSPAALTLTERAVRRFFPARPLPALEFDRIPDTARTLVVIPALVSSRERAIQLLEHLAVLERAGGDGNLAYLLACDYRDSEAAQEIDDADIAAVLHTGVDHLNAQHPGKFYYLHRKRVYDRTHKRHMGPMRKRGALLCVCDLIEDGKTDAEIAEISFDPAALRHRFPYILAVDSDTLLPPGCAQRLIGAMEHPLCRASILAPRMESAPRLIGTHLGDILGGPGGMPLYPGGAGEMYQTLCGRGSFAGKGLIRVRDYREKTAFVPARYALSHDLLEGELCQSALMENAALFDGPCLRTKPFYLQLERWTRGDWQLTPWLFSHVPLGEKRRIKNPLSPLSRVKILDNLRRSLIAPAQLLTLFLFAALGNVPACVLALTLPHLGALLSMDGRTLKNAYMRIALLPRLSYISLCAAARALTRQYVTGEHLLDWTTAHDAHALPDSGKGDALEIWFAAALVLFSVPALHALSVTVWIALAFFLSPRFVRHLNAPLHETRPLDESERADLLRWARSTWAFFEKNVTQATHFLPPDHLQTDPPQKAATRTSPTNIGLYLLSCIGAQQLGLIEPDELLTRLMRTLASLQALPKWRGHLYNWIDTHTLCPLDPLLVSSVDSGNYLACLIVCIQSLRTLPALGPDGLHLADAYEALFDQTDIAVLYDTRCDLFFVSADVSSPDSPRFSPAHYDQLASESRLFSYIAVAHRAVPLRHWLRLSRRFSRTPFGSALLSWSGTMFEYLMPRLLQRGAADSLLFRACQTAVLVQMSMHGGAPWGVSESGRYVFDEAKQYQYHAFGVPQLSLRSDRFLHVITPYAGALALSVFPHAAVKNLRHMESIGLFDAHYGFYEAADYTGADGMRIVKSHMAHHQGMLFCAIVNALTGNALVTLFHRDPAMEAFSLLLEEQIP